LPVADNLLDQTFTVCGPNRTWVSDITYISTDEGWFYSVAHMNLFNSEIVSYALGSRITRDPIITSLLMAEKKKPTCARSHQSFWSVKPILLAELRKTSWTVQHEIFQKQEKTTLFW
jgi:transposase InsO family protein